LNIHSVQQDGDMTAPHCNAWL